MIDRPDSHDRLRALLRRMFSMSGDDPASDNYRAVESRKQELTSFIDRDIPEIVERLCSQLYPGNEQQLMVKIYTDLYRFFSQHDRDAWRMIGNGAGYQVCVNGETGLIWPDRDIYYITGQDRAIYKNPEGYLSKALDEYVRGMIDPFNMVNESSLKQSMARCRIVKQTGGEIIKKLCSLEDLRKYAWEMKKSAVETDYVIRLGMIPETLRRDVLKNKKQTGEWKRLFDVEVDSEEGIDDVRYDSLPVDTALLNKNLKSRLLKALTDIDNDIDGRILFGDNYHALNHLLDEYRGKVKCIYIDPPYNTGSASFLYKDGFDHSHWLSMMNDRLRLARELMSDNGVMFISIGDEEADLLGLLLKDIFGPDMVDRMIWRKSGDSRDGKMKNTATFRKDHEYVFVVFRQVQQLNKIKELPAFMGDYSNPDNDPRGDWLSGSISRAETSSNPESDKFYTVISPSGRKFTRQFDVPRDEFKRLENEGRIFWGENGNNVPRLKVFINEKREITPYSVLLTKGTTTDGTKELGNVIGDMALAKRLRPKPSSLIKTLLQLGTDKDSIVMDFFAGSGTTGFSTLLLNDEECLDCKYIMVEMGESIGAILLERMKKAMYARKWEGGRPLNVNGIGKAFKYQRLETYEDALDKLIASSS